MKEVYRVDIRIFDTFEGTSTIIKKTVIASDEDEARDLVRKMMDREIEEINASCAGYEIVRGEVVRELHD